ncbi:MAG: hypothetical protein GEU82_14365 [Luteitalea sp.]|nr:hypothetical protein [Luteitalea sp.]
MRGSPFGHVRLLAPVLAAVLLLMAAPHSLRAVAVSTPAMQAGASGDARADKKPVASVVWTDHLKVETYPSETAAAPGGKVSLIVKIEPVARMHVYAPGADDYRIVTLTVAAQRFVRLAPTRYPASEMYLFEPLNERIPAYQKPFTLVQEVTLDSQPEARAALRATPSLTLTGTLDYQACDDRICFKPVSVPLTWTVAMQTGRPSGAGGTGTR